MDFFLTESTEDTEILRKLINGLLSVVVTIHGYDKTSKFRLCEELATKQSGWVTVFLTEENEDTEIVVGRDALGAPFRNALIAIRRLRAIRWLRAIGNRPYDAGGTVVGAIVNRPFTSRRLRWIGDRPYAMVAGNTTVTGDIAKRRAEGVAPYTHFVERIFNRGGWI